MALVEKPGSPTPAFAVTSANLPPPRLRNRRFGPAVGAGAGDVGVDVAVVVVVGGRGAQAVHLPRQPRRPRHVGEAALAVVPVERGQTGLLGTAREARGVHEEEVLRAVAVEGEEQ